LLTVHNLYSARHFLFLAGWQVYSVVSILNVFKSSYLNHFVHGSHKVHDLKHVHSHDADARAPGLVVGLPLVVESTLGAAHEVVEEVVHDLDDVHHGLAALHDLAVEGGLDVGLDVLNKVLLDILLELGAHESLLGAHPHLWVGDHQRQQRRHVRHDPLQQRQGHCQEQRPRAHLCLREHVSGGVELPGEGVDHR